MRKFIEVEINIIRNDLLELGVIQNGENIPIQLDLNRVESYRPTSFDDDEELVRTMVVMHSGYEYVLTMTFSEFDYLMKSFLSPTNN
ncbi:hypothetical protein D3C80_1557860 [compost metagenome]